MNRFRGWIFDNVIEPLFRLEIATREVELIGRLLERYGRPSFYPAPALGPGVTISLAPKVVKPNLNTNLSKKRKGK